jgi:hypothetical protein
MEMFIYPQYRVVVGNISCKGSCQAATGSLGHGLCSGFATVYYLSSGTLVLLAHRPVAPGSMVLVFGVRQMAKPESTPASIRAALKETIEATLRFLPASKDQIDEAYLEHNKLILVEDFGVEVDEELRSLIMAYRPVKSTR